MSEHSGLILEPQPLEEVMPLILQLCLMPQTRGIILRHISVPETRLNYNKYVNKLIKVRYLKYVDPRLRSSKSEYLTTLKGKKYLTAIQ